MVCLFVCFSQLINSDIVGKALDNDVYDQRVGLTDASNLPDLDRDFGCAGIAKFLDLGIG
ncbi:hypothetical protein MNBD_ALPHA04-253, partial [hydrothermal vent metagenome]